ncbi:hypothetical protein BHM03_00045806 [Ensete ventricosum]|nr:hypothetical protein BHM03_00045806 [Ensete ventricosum]
MSSVSFAKVTYGPRVVPRSSSVMPVPSDVLRGVRLVLVIVQLGYRLCQVGRDYARSTVIVPGQWKVSCVALIRDVRPRVVPRSSSVVPVPNDVVRMVRLVLVIVQLGYRLRQVGRDCARSTEGVNLLFLFCFTVMTTQVTEDLRGR